MSFVEENLVVLLSLSPDGGVDGGVETDSGPKAQREFHVSDTIRGNTYTTTRVVRDVPYAIMARRAL